MTPQIMLFWPQHHTWKNKNKNNGHAQEMIFHVYPFIVFAIHSTIVNEGIQGVFQNAKNRFVVLQFRMPF